MEYCLFSILLIVGFLLVWIGVAIHRIGDEIRFCRQTMIDLCRDYGLNVKLRDGNWSPFSKTSAEKKAK